MSGATLCKLGMEVRFNSRQYRDTQLRPQMSNSETSWLAHLATEPTEKGEMTALTACSVRHVVNALLKPTLQIIE